MMKNKTIVIAGGSGFIGQALIKYFGKENKIFVFGRNISNSHSNAYTTDLQTKSDGYNVEYIQWNPSDIKANWTKYVDGADIVINLAGKSVNCRYHKKQKEEIIASRINATDAVGAAINSATNKPVLWINTSSATIYANSIDKPNDEFNGTISDFKKDNMPFNFKDNMPFNFIDYIRFKKKKMIARLLHGKNSKRYMDLDKDFSIKVCKEWEKTFFSHVTPGTRKVALRAAITLGEGGVLIPYFNLCKFGLGGKHGNGKQKYSWVHIHDLCGMIEWLFEKQDAEGVYNCSSPNPVTNEEFMSTVRQATGHSCGLPAPTPLLEAGAFLLQTETELMLKSRWVLPTRALNEGFEFRYPILREALSQIIAITPRRKYRLF